MDYRQRNDGGEHVADQESIPGHGAVLGQGLQQLQAGRQGRDRDRQQEGETGGGLTGEIGE